jgi:hypothetical protein
MMPCIQLKSLFFWIRISPTPSSISRVPLHVHLSEVCLTGYHSKQRSSQTVQAKNDYKVYSLLKQDAWTLSCDFIFYMMIHNWACFQHPPKTPSLSSVHFDHKKRSWAIMNVLKPAFAMELCKTRLNQTGKPGTQCS